MNKFRKLGFIEYNRQPGSPQFLAERGPSRQSPPQAMSQQGLSTGCLRSIEGRFGATRDGYSYGITSRTAPFCNRGFDLASERFDHACADPRRLRVGVQR
jgi:hypothetical protein